MNKKLAQDLIAKELIASLPEETLNKKNVSIESVSQTGSTHAIVEATLRTAFKFTKVNGKWVITEVRVGNRPWEKIDNILRALDRVKSEETRRLLDQIGAAVEAFWEKNGSLPNFTNYVSLSDTLSPNYLATLIREDAWRRPLAAYRLGSNSLRLVSSGPDGLWGSGDDIELRKNFSR